MQMSHKFKRLCQWAVIGGFRSVLFVKHVERWMAKDIRYARNTESGYNKQSFQVLAAIVSYSELFCTLLMV